MADAPAPSFFARHRLASALGVAVGLLLAGLAGVVLLAEDLQREGRDRQAWAPFKVAVAAHALKAGDVVREADLDFRTLPENSRSPSLVYWDWRTMAVGQRLVGDVPAQELLRWTDFTPAASAPSLSLREGFVGVNVDAASLPTVKPGERVKVSRRNRYTAVGRPLVADARVVAVDGTTGPEPGEDEKNDGVVIALLEVSAGNAAELAVAMQEDDLILERLPADGAQASEEAP